MDINHYGCTRTGRTNLEKTMEDGNYVNAKDDKSASGSIPSLYSERPAKLTTNGHDIAGESSSPPCEPYEQCRPGADNTHDEKFKKRINPLRIHLGKRPFIDNSHQYYNSAKKKKPYTIRSNDINTPISTVHRAPKLIIKRNIFPNVSSQSDNSVLDNEKDKPVPRLVPKSQISQFKKGKVQKGAQLKEYAQSLGLQPMVKFKCRKCCSMSFKTLALLKEHQQVCRVQSKEPALSPEATPNADASSGGPSRVTRKVYLCSACGTYYENWNLFLHMREVHNRHICLFCLGMFSKAEKLSAHLTNKHNVQECKYDNKEDFFSVYNGTLYLMCCVCDEICSEKEDFFNHDCNNVKPKPVPVLVSKNAIKTNMKPSKLNNEPSSNGPTTLVKNLTKPSDKKEISEVKETVTSQKTIVETSKGEPVNSDTSLSSESSLNTSKDTSKTIDSGMELDRSNERISSPNDHRSVTPERNDTLPNGEDSLDHTDGSVSPVPEPVINNVPIRPQDTICPPIEKEKECGIKLKLSLNNAKSPVIINSTVDPSIGQQKVNKPPSRVRRPPKRYEKDNLSEPSLTPQPKLPSIKMTICDKADSPFVKTTIYENNQETTLKTLLNNNLESIPSEKTLENKPENLIKTTIYDNKLEDVNTLHRVPKLTVRVPKELLDKDSSSEYSSDSDVSDKLTVDENNTILEEIDKPKEETQPEPPIFTETADSTQDEIKEEKYSPVKEENVQTTDENMIPKTESIDEKPKILASVDTEVDIETKTDDPAPIDETPVTELTLDRPLDKYPLKELLKVFLTSTVYNCIYCNHVRKIAVNCEQLSLHMVAEHRFSATVDSITAEELMPETIIAKVKSGAEEMRSVYINLDSYDSVEKCEEVKNDHVFECFQCYFKTAIHKDLYLHNRKMHQKTILLCVMCKTNFYSYSELLCHLCPGTYDSEYEIKYRCCLCNVDSIPSSFRLMVHLRKIHHTCDVCLELCQSQVRLSNHVWKHKLHHLCYRCGIAYRNKPDITNHLFWKHGTESVLCKKCLQKKWPHVYHFCTPPAVFVCDECTLQFTKAVYLKVHKRFHSGEYPHLCTEDGCTEKFVSKKMLNKHMEQHKQKVLTDSIDDKRNVSSDTLSEPKEPIPVIDLVDEKPIEESSLETKPDGTIENVSKKKKKKSKDKDKDALLIDVNLPETLDLSESDSSDESDSAIRSPIKEENPDEIAKEEEKLITNNVINSFKPDAEIKPEILEKPLEKLDEEKPNEQQVLDIWDNFKKYQAKVEKQKEKTPPLVPIRKHVCESDHDYCLIPTDLNGDEDIFNADKKKNKKSPKKKHGDLSSSSSSSSDSDSSCSCGSNCSCSSTSGSSSSSSSDSDSSDDSGHEKKKSKRKSLPNRRISNGSNVDVMGMSETPILIPEKPEPPIPETDLETNESETDEEFYDEHPQKVASKLYAEKRNQPSLLASLAPSDGCSLSEEVSRSATPMKEVKDVKEIEPKPELELKEEPEIKEKATSSKKKSKKKKKSRSSRKHFPIKINIPKDKISKSEMQTPIPPLAPNKITISLQSNTVQIPEPPTMVASLNSNIKSTPSVENKRASKRRRVPNKFYGYSSDEESPQTTPAALKPQLPPKLEWRKEDLPSPVTQKTKKEPPTSTMPQRLFNYTEPIRLTTPIPDPEPPRNFMNSDSMESSDSDTSEEGALEIFQPKSIQSAPPVPPPTYLNSGTSSLPYQFQRPAVRQAREGESVYCYCRCPYDEVSEMIACDAEGCPIEWFHFECVGIMVPPKGKWYCPECRKNQSFSGYR